MLQNIYGAADGSKTSSRTEYPKAIGVWPDAFLTSLTMHLWMQSAKLGSYSTAEDRAGGSLSPNPAAHPCQPTSGLAAGLAHALAPIDRHHEACSRLDSPAGFPESLRGPPRRGPGL